MPPLGISQYLMIGKLIALLGAIGIICFQSSQIHKWHRQDEGHVAELNRITSEKNNQGQRTIETIKVVTKTIHDADGRAKIVEQAPPAPDCHTKPEVMNADI